MSEVTYGLLYSSLLQQYEASDCCCLTEKAILNARATFVFMLVLHATIFSGTKGELASKKIPDMKN
ncbi:MAG: hypothetical protein VYC76_03495, partial [Pseudomonadota bacterium]|nr:hypothetical protein [Pseudomonadota bacterium]